MALGAALATVLPTFRLSSAEVGGPAALAAYQELHREIFPCRPAAGFSPEEVVVEMTGWHLGRVIFAVIRSSPLVFERTPEIVATGGIDHILVQHYPEGGFSGTAEGRRIEVRPGDICVFDLGQTMHTQTSWSLSHSLMVPRPLFEAVIDDVSALHGMVMAGEDPLTMLLAAHLAELAEHVAALETRAAAAAGHGTVAMIATILATLAPRHARPTPMAIPSLFRKISIHIDTNLGDPGMTPATIAGHFGMSRATLYRLFDSLGGVADYIRRRRLITAALRLASPEHRAKRVAQIALACGFANEASFSRSFTRQFGISPSEARSRADRIWAAQGWGAGDVDPVREFRIWMKTLRT